MSQQNNKFARWTFRIAGIYGLLVLLPQYFLEGWNGRVLAINHPEYYYGFIGIAVAWQIVFLIISREPERHRPLMLAAVIEKYSYGIATVVLYLQGRSGMEVLMTGAIDMALGVLFLIAFLRTKN
ncbi:MAG: hypothetical protein IPM66_13920 [Acidobacteriota bacterium]|nr:MAG: hypothetical protein IPM66_13920 [Acidobacteriota bacterium]